MNMRVKAQILVSDYAAEHLDKSDAYKKFETRCIPDGTLG